MIKTVAEMTKAELRRFRMRVAVDVAAAFSEEVGGSGQGEIEAFADKWIEMLELFGHWEGQGWPGKVKDIAPYFIDGFEFESRQARRITRAIARELAHEINELAREKWEAMQGKPRLPPAPVSPNRTPSVNAAGGAA